MPRFWLLLLTLAKTAPHSLEHGFSSFNGLVDASQESAQVLGYFLPQGYCIEQETEVQCEEVQTPAHVDEQMNDQEEEDLQAEAVVNEASLEEEKEHVVEEDAEKSPLKNPFAIEEEATPTNDNQSELVNTTAVFA